MFQIPPIIIIAAVIAVCMLAVYAFTVAMAMLPSIVAVVLLGVLVKRKRPAWSPKAQIKGCGDFNGDAIAGVVVLLVAGVVIGQSIASMWPELVGIFDGDEMFKHLAGLILRVAFAGGAFYVFNEINEGRIEMARSIFDLVENKSAFNEFVQGTSRPVVLDIKPERDIPLIQEQVIGQDQIVADCISHIARMARREVRKKPLGVFLFVGASGAGKSELAKAISKVCFDGRYSEHFMNQMKSDSDINQLFGPPPGYIGSDKGGKLTQEVKKLRSCVINLDEIEKAHKSIFDAIMTLLDEGKMTDASTGEVIDATNCVIVMTSNAEQKEIAKIVQEISDPDDQMRAIKDKLQSYFKPEQLARMSIIAPFKPLERDSLAKIIGKFLFKYADDNKVEIIGLDHNLLVQLIKRHEKNSDYGIRNLITLIEKDVEDGMADAKDEGFKYVRILMKPTGKFDKSGEEEMKPVVVGVPEEEVLARQEAQATSAI